MIKDAVLAAAISSVTPEPIVERRVNVPAIVRRVENYAPPLDLEAVVFRYRVFLGRVDVLVRPRGAAARVCRSALRHRISRPKSSSR